MEWSVHPWSRFFSEHHIDCQLENLKVPERAPDTDILIVRPVELTVNQLGELFKKTLLDQWEVVPFIAPIHTGDEILQLSNLVPVHDRDVFAGSYAHWVKAHVAKGDDGTLKCIAEFDSSMTLPEAMLYNLMMLQWYGAEYLKVIYDDTHWCSASERSSGTRKVRLRWDLHDIKVCLDLH